ncbi:MAG: ubiquinone/menaquinone biosynthesis methyltransferase [Chloroflexi bacterium]|nr:ubiquinone/menaquinone biosynthesis methyltransferase [Chloroflexota bacterium]
MSAPSASARALDVRKMFSRIALRYDLLNRLMTAGQDVRWRRQAIQKLKLRENTNIIDIGTGTGDLAIEVARSHPSVRIIACDFTPEMIGIAKRRQREGKIDWVIADAQQLPFPNNIFSGAISGFFLRNAADLDKALSQQHRVLADDGCIVSVDTTPPQPGFFFPLIMLHLKFIIPLLGKLLTGNRKDYQYLTDSTTQFLNAENLAERLRVTGFEEVNFMRRMFGSVAIHWGKKPK